MTDKPKTIFELLRDRHPAPAWAYMEEVRNATGFGKVTRTSDALAMSLFPSRGLHLNGFEVKVSRSDWLRELKSPAKAEEIARFCHYWWLVVSDATIVRDGELPQPWGLLERRGDKLVQAKAAVFNEDALPPSFRFVAAVFRKFCATETVTAKIDEAFGNGRAQGWTAGIEHATRHSNEGRAQKELEELQRAVKTFEDRSGIAINRWMHGNIGEAVRLLVSGHDNPIHKLARFADDAEEIAKAARAAHASVVDGLKITHE